MLELWRIFTAVKLPDGTVKVLMEGDERVRIKQAIDVDGVTLASVAFCK